MANKLIAFSTPAQASSLPVPEPPHRVIVNIGKQRIALDISCHAMVLNPRPGPIVALPVPTPRRKKRKARRP